MKHFCGLFAAWLVLLIATSVAPPIAEAAEGLVTWAVHVSLVPTWFDPAETSGILSQFLILYALHDAMVKPMPGQPMAPGLAESWTASADGLVYDFVLRRGVTFHNGDPVTAEDVKSGVVPPGAPRPTPPRRPARDHPWSRSIRLHVLRKTLRAQGMTFSLTSDSGQERSRTACGCTMKMSSPWGYQLASGPGSERLHGRRPPSAHPALSDDASRAHRRGGDHLPRDPASTFLESRG